MKRAIIFSGNLQNVGDLALLLQCAHGLRELLGIDEIFVRQWSGVHPDVAAQLAHHRIKVLNGKNFINCLKLLPGTLLLFGGGQMVRDNTSEASTFAIGVMMWLAKFVGGRSAAIGCGASRIGKPRHLTLWKFIVGQLRFFAARDESSLAVIKELDTGRPAFLTADLIHLPSTLTRSLAAKSATEHFLIAPCEDPSEDRSISKQLVVGVVATYQQLTGPTRSIIACHDSRPGMDPVIAHQIEEELQSAGLVVSTHEGYVLREFFELYKRANFVLTNRLHSVFFAAIAGKPIVLIDDGNSKTRNAAGRLNIPALSASASSEEIWHAVQAAIDPAVLQQRRDTIASIGLEAKLNFDLLHSHI